MTIYSHKDLIVWQKGIMLSKQIYLLTEKFPREELYGITSQMRRAAVSIPSNIAEGRSRGTRKDFVQFLRIAIGSASELETQIEIAKQLPKTKEYSYKEVDILLSEVSRMTMAMIKKLSVKASP
ncbi:MAG: four helix bundle protein [bacterium]|nr:four helix bundle protein [bacterium]